MLSLEQDDGYVLLMLFFSNQHPHSTVVYLNIGSSLHPRLECDKFGSCCNVVVSWAGSAENIRAGLSPKGQNSS